MVIDRLWRRQMACTTIQLRKCHAGRGPGSIECVRAFGGDKRSLIEIWKEVDLLKELSHIGILEKAKANI